MNDAQGMNNGGLGAIPGVNAQAMLPRVITRYQIPKSVGGEDWKSVGMVEIQYYEEVMAAKRAGDDRYVIATELAKESLREVNGKPVSTTDGSADAIFNKMPPRVRQLIVAAYGKHHNVSAEESQAFLGSATTATIGG